VIPPLQAFLDGYRTWARGRGIAARFDEQRVAEALDEADQLAPRPAEEPAAILYAFSKRPRALQDGWDFVERCALNLARVELGAEIVLENPDRLDFLRLRVLANQASFEEVRSFIAARLRRFR
jgi:hypothetical protein